MPIDEESKEGDESGAVNASNSDQQLTWVLDQSDFELTNNNIIQCLSNFLELYLIEQQRGQASNTLNNHTQAQAFSDAIAELNNMLIAVLNKNDALVGEDVHEEPGDLANIFLIKLNFGFEGEGNQNLLFKAIVASEMLHQATAASIVRLLTAEQEGAAALEENPELLEGRIPEELQEDLFRSDVDGLSEVLLEYLKDNIEKARHISIPRRRPSV